MKGVRERKYSLPETDAVADINPCVPSDGLGIRLPANPEACDNRTLFRLLAAGNELERRNVGVGEHTLSYLTSGLPGAGAAPVVLLHGFAVSSRYMIPLARLLSAHTPVLAPDLPGSGRSSNPDRVLGIPDLAEVLVAFLDAVGIERVSLVGNSFGCQIALAAAVQHPERIERMVLVGPTVAPGLRRVSSVIAGLLQDALLEPALLVPIAVWDYFDFGARRAWGTLRLLLEDKPEEKLPFIKAPTLVVRGERDPLAPASWTRRMAGMLPQGDHLTIPDAAHAVHFNHPHTMARVIRDFGRYGV